MSGDLPWIPMALSTVKSATSPRLSTIRLSLIRLSIASQSVPSVIEVIGHDLRSVADEVARIEREFGGAVNFTVLRDPEFGVVFDALNVRFRFCGTDDASRSR